MTRLDIIKFDKSKLISFQILSSKAWCLVILASIMLVITNHFTTGMTYLHSLSTVYNTYIQRNGVNFAKCQKLHTKILHFTMDLTAFFLIASFSAILTSFMTFQSKSFEVNSFQDILDKKLFLVTIRDAAEHDYLQRAKENSVARVYQEMLKDPRHFSPSLLEMEKVLAENPNAVAYLSDLVLPGFANPQNMISFEKVFHDILKRYVSFAYPKDSEIADAFDYHLHNMQQSGILHKITERWFGKKWVNSETSKSTGSTDAEKLGFEQVVSIVIILFCGILTSILIVFLEKCYYYVL